jgi:hypothetical protein
VRAISGAVAIVIGVCWNMQAVAACVSYRFTVPASLAKSADTAQQCAALRQAAVDALKQKHDDAITARMRAFDAQKAAESTVYRCSSDNACATARAAWKKAQDALAAAERNVERARIAATGVGRCECSTESPAPEPVVATAKAKTAKPAPPPPQKAARSEEPSPSPSTEPSPVGVAEAPVIAEPAAPKPAAVPVVAEPATIAAAPAEPPAPEPAPAPQPELAIAAAEPAPEPPPAPAAVPAIPVVALASITTADPAFPQCLVTKLASGSRFAEAPYFALMAASGLRALPPKTISNRMKAAGENGENYKALFFARLLTDAVPDNRAVWANRAALAGALGLAAEAAACGEKSQTPDAPVPVPSELLPGRVAARPSTLADWAAALAMMADGVAQREGGGLVAIKDDVSGIEPVIPSSEEGKPSARALPIRVEDVAPNLFVLREPKAMFTKSVNKGQMALMLFSAATMAYGSYHGVTSGMEGVSQLYGNSAAQAFSVPSKYKDGSYSTRTFGADGKPVDAKVKPRTAGEADAVDLPFPVLWASGGALRPAFRGRLATGHGKNASTSIWDEAAKKSRTVTPPDLDFPRVASLCLGRCTPPVTLQELILEAEDLRVMFGDEAAAVAAKTPDLSEAREAYARRDPELKIAGPDQQQLSRLTGYAAGSCYDIEMMPNAWVIAAPAAPAPKKKK